MAVQSKNIPGILKDLSRLSLWNLHSAQGLLKAKNYSLPRSIPTQRVKNNHQPLPTPNQTPLLTLGSFSTSMLFRIQRHSFSNLWENPKVGLVLTTGRAALEKHEEQLSRGSKVSVPKQQMFPTHSLQESQWLLPWEHITPRCCCCAEFLPWEHRDFYGCCTHRKLHLSTGFHETEIKKSPTAAAIGTQLPIFQLVSFQSALRVSQGKDHHFRASL